MQISRNENLNSNLNKLKHKKRKSCTGTERQREAKERTRLLSRSFAARLGSRRTLRKRTMEKKSAAATFCAERQQDTTRAATKDEVEYPGR
ncbi:unnamed protein product [Sphagnum jensenii]